MGHRTLARATLLIAAVFLVAAVVFAAAGRISVADEPALTNVSGPVVAGEGAAEFEARCGHCHERGDLAAWARAHPDPDARGQWLATVLETHFPPPPDERAAIIGHIQRVIGDGDPTD